MNKFDTDTLGKEFLKKFDSFRIDDYNSIKELKKQFNIFENDLKQLVKHYNFYDKEILNSNNNTLKEYRNRLYSLIQLCQFNVINPIQSKMLGIETDKQLKYGRNSIHLGITSIILGLLFGIGGIIYSNYLNKDAITSDYLGKKNKELIEIINDNFEYYNQNTIDSLSEIDSRLLIIEKSIEQNNK